MNKRGIFFTLLGIILVGLFIESFAFYVQYRQTRAMDAVEMRINSMNELLKSVNTDLQRALYISSFRAILSLTAHVTSTGNSLTSTESSFIRMLENGTVNGTYVEPLMVNQTIKNWTKKICALAQQIDVNLSIKIINLTVYQSSPWAVNVRTAVNLSLTDKKRTASWHKSSTITTAVDLETLEEPLYAILSNGVLHRSIAKSNVTSWNISSLKQHLVKNTYVANTNAPSFMLRLEGKFDASANGIETLIDTNEWLYRVGPVKHTSSVDYIYFSNRGNKNYSIHNITDKGYGDFRLDSDHVKSYNVLGYNYTG